MLQCSAVLLAITIVMAVFGFTEISAPAASVARKLFIVCLTFFVVSLFTSALRRG